MRDKIIKALEGSEAPLKAKEIAFRVCERLENVHRVLRGMVTAKTLHMTGNGFYRLNGEEPPPKPPRVTQPTKKSRRTPIAAKPSGKFPWTPKPQTPPPPTGKSKKYPVKVLPDGSIQIIQEADLNKQAEDLREKRETSKRPIDVVTTNQKQEKNQVDTNKEYRQKLMDEADQLAKHWGMPVVNIPELVDAEVKTMLAERLMAGMTPEMAVQFEQWITWTNVVIALGLPNAKASVALKPDSDDPDG